MRTTENKIATLYKLIKTRRAAVLDTATHLLGNYPRLYCHLLDQAAMIHRNEEVFRIIIILDNDEFAGRCISNECNDTRVISAIIRCRRSPIAFALEATIFLHSPLGNVKYRENLRNGDRRAY